MEPADKPAPPAPSRNYGWIWYFVILAALTLLATSVLVVYNLQQQLRPEQLEAARRLWKEQGPDSYRLVYDIKMTDRTNMDHYDVTVKKGEVAQVLVNEQPQPANRFHHYGMEQLYNYIEGFQDIDKKKGQPRTYTRAIFDPVNGGLRWYVRRVMGSKERVEITVDRLETN